MKRIHIFIFLNFILSGISFASEVKEDPTEEDLEKTGDLFERLNSDITIKYREGRNLIYDCSEAHFLCVDKEGFKICEKEREEAIKNGNENLQCTPLRQFPTKRACVKMQYEKINNPMKKNFCYKK